MAYTREIEGASYIVQSSGNIIAILWAMQVGSRNERTIDSCTNDSK